MKTRRLIAILIALCFVNTLSLTIAEGVLDLNELMNEIDKEAKSLNVGQATFRISQDKQSIYIDRPEITGSDEYTIAYNIYDNNSNPVNYFYSTEEHVAATPGYGGLFNVFIVVTDQATGESNTQNIGWQKLNWPSANKLTVGKATFELSPDRKSIFVDRPEIKCKSGEVTIAYNIYDHNSQPVNYFYSTEKRVAATPGYDGKFNVFIVVTDTGTGEQDIQNIGWQVLGEGVPEPTATPTPSPTVVPEINIVTQPQNQTAARGEQVDLSVVAENVQFYIWQYSDDDGATWHNFTSGGHNTPDLTYVVELDHYTRLIRCKLTGLTGAVVYTDVVRLEAPDVIIISQPENITASVGEEVTLSVIANNVKNYLWQFSDNEGASWYGFTFGGYNTANLTLTVEPEYYSYQIRCRLTGYNGSVTFSDSVTIEAAEISILTQPQSVTAAIGETVKLIVSAENAKSYLWQYSDDEGTVWNNYTSGGYNTSSLTFTVSIEDYDRLIRCRLTGYNGIVLYTDTVELLAPEMRITSQPEDQIAAIGEDVRLSVSAENVRNYLWQFSIDEGTTWSNFTTSGYNTTSVKFTVELEHYDRLIRCRLTGLNGAIVYTNTVKLISPDVSITRQPQTYTAFIGEQVTLTVSAEYVRAYKWQYSEDGGTVWKDYTSNGYDTAMFTYVVETSHYDRLTRCMLTGLNAEGKLLPPSQRITRFGSFMRKYSLDELLNFWSVLKGDMSLIGPRPLPMFFHDRMSDRHRCRELVRPGLECPRVITVEKEGKYICPYHQQFENDLWYVQHVSFSTDLKMLFMLVRMTLNTRKRSTSAQGTTSLYFVGYDEDGYALDMGMARELYKNI